MKLRIRGDSLRLRLSQGEMNEIGSRGSARDRMRLPGGAELKYALEVDTDDRLAVAFVGDEIKVTVPRASVERWLEPEEVSITGICPLEGGGSLSVLVEKDFACLAPREGEDESDLFPNPAKL